MTQAFRIAFSGQVEVDFGSLPQSETTFIVADSRVKSTSRIHGQVAYIAPTGKDLDELEMDAIDIKFGAGNGVINIYMKGMEGYLADKFVINYVVG